MDGPPAVLHASELGYCSVLPSRDCGLAFIPWPVLQLERKELVRQQLGPYGTALFELSDALSDREGKCRDF